MQAVNSLPNTGMICQTVGANVHTCDQWQPKILRSSHKQRTSPVQVIADCQYKLDNLHELFAAFDVVDCIAKDFYIL